MSKKEKDKEVVETTTVVEEKVVVNPNEKTIKSIVFDLTSNGNPVVRIVTEDMLDGLTPIEVYGEDKFKFLFFTKTVGDTVILFKQGDWYKLEMAAESKPSQSKILSNIFNTMKYIKDDSRIEVSPEEAQSQLNEYLKTDVFFTGLAMRFFLEDNSDFSKLIKEQMEVVKSKQTLDPFSVIALKAKEFIKIFNAIIVKSE